MPCTRERLSGFYTLDKLLLNTLLKARLIYTFQKILISNQLTYLFYREKHFLKEWPIMSWIQAIFSYFVYKKLLDFHPSIYFLPHFRCQDAGAACLTGNSRRPSSQQRFAPRPGGSSSSFRFQDFIFSCQPPKYDTVGEAAIADIINMPKSSLMPTRHM